MSNITLGMSVSSCMDGTTKKWVFYPTKHPRTNKIADKSVQVMCPDTFFNVFKHSGPHNKQRIRSSTSLLCSTLDGFNPYQHHSTNLTMPNSYPCVVIFSLLRTTIKDSHYLLLQLKSIELPHESWQNQQNGMCAQRRLRSAWASAQTDQGLRCLHEEKMDL